MLHITNEDVTHYYQSSQRLFHLFIYNHHTLGMHYGFWDKKTKNRQQAILNENQEIIRQAHITKRMRVLDAGCGVGGSAIYIAKRTHAHVWGITIDPKQVILARKYAEAHGVSALTQFSTQDYAHTLFPDNYFDAIYAVESVCHAHPKRSFLREAHRVLKPKGRLLVFDGYLRRLPKTHHEQQLLHQFCAAFAIAPLIGYRSMIHQVYANGFIQCKVEDKTVAMAPSSAQLAHVARITGPIADFCRYIPYPLFQSVYRNSLAVRLGQEGIEIGLLGYYMHVGVKPSKRK